MPKRVDVAVVGAGIVGSLSAIRLARQGVEVALIDAGPEPLRGRGLKCNTKPRHHVQSGLYNYSPAAANFLVDDVDFPYTTPVDRPFVWIRGRQVGGRLHLWDGCCPRFVPSMFERRFDGRQLWPLSFSDLARYYDDAEAALQVGSGSLSDAEQDLFYHLNSNALGQVISRPLARLSYLELITRLEEFPNLQIYPNRVAVRVVLDEHQEFVVGIECLCGSSELELIRCGCAILSASTLESTRLLLLSTSSRFPRGLGDKNGVLGHYLMDHTCGAVCTGIGPFTGSPSGGIYIYPELNSEQQFFGVQAEVPSGAQQFWMVAMAETVPKLSNRVHLTRNLLDRDRLPTLHIDMAYGKIDRKRHAEAVAFLDALQRFFKPVCSHLASELHCPGESVHEMGTARMGFDESDSFLNHWCQSWHVPNLFVTDGSAFPTSAHPNPTLTMVALSLRTCDYLRQNKLFALS